MEASVVKVVNLFIALVPFDVFKNKYSLYYFLS